MFLYQYHLRRVCRRIGVIVEVFDLLLQSAGKAHQSLVETCGEAALSESNSKSLGMIQMQENWIPYELKSRNLKRRVSTRRL